MSTTAKLWSEFLPQWVVANTAGWIFYSFRDPLYFHYIRGTMDIGPLIAIFLSILQWLVLKKHMGVDTMWIWVGSLSYWIYIISLSAVSGGLETFLLSTLVLFLVGFLQRSVLDYHFDNSGRWIVASGLAGASALILSYIIASLFLSKTSLLIVWGIYGGVYGTLTGVVLMSMYPQPINKALT